MNGRVVMCGIAAGAVVGWMLGLAGEIQAQLHVDVDVGRHPGASIRFGSVPPPRPIVVTPPASIRYEHFHERRPWVATPPSGVVYRNPYADTYFRRFRPGYHPLVVGPTQYYFYPVLPPLYQTVVVNGVTYYLADGVYYQPYLYQGQTVYMVVPPPIP
jgi:hypothetical protein